MKYIFVVLAFVVVAVAVNALNNTSSCTSSCSAKPNSKLACKLTSPELRERKENVIKSLKNQIIDKQELENGYSYKFANSNKMEIEIAEFVKTEKACCDFFNFKISYSIDGKEAVLEITGPEGAKEFINTELEM